MKIAMVHNQYHTHGGTERYMVDLTNFLIKKGHDLHVFTGEWEEEAADESIKFHKTPVWGKKLGIDKYIFARNAETKVSNYDFEIVQSFSRVGFGDVIMIGGGCHSIYLRRRIENIDNSLYKFLKKIDYKVSIKHYLTKYYEAKDFKAGNYNKIMAVSQKVKEQIRANYEVPENDIIVNYNGVDIDKFHPRNKSLYRSKIREKHNLNPDDIVLLFVGTGFKRKGLKYALQTLQKVKDVKLLVIGKGKINHYKRQARKYNIENRVKFLGTRANVEAYYGASDIFIFPTVYEPFGLVITEAMASGLPVVTSARAGAAELLENGREGFVADAPHYTEQLAKYVEKLKDKGLREEFSKKARSTAENYTQERNHKKVLEIYRDILEDRNQNSLLR